VAAHAELKDGNLSILAGVWSLDGTEKLIENTQVTEDYFHPSLISDSTLRVGYSTCLSLGIIKLSTAVINFILQ
jgi:hypothetical protein